MYRLTAATGLAALLVFTLPAAAETQSSTTALLDASATATEVPREPAEALRGWAHAPAPPAQDPTTLLRVGLSEDYLHAMQSKPLAFKFRWEGFARHLKVKVTPGERWREEGGSRGLQLIALAVRGGQIVDRATSGSFDVDAERAASADWIEVPDPAVSSLGERLPGLGEQVRIDFDDRSQIRAPFPGSMVSPPTPSKVAQAAQGGDAILVYLDFADEAHGEGAATRPLVLMLPESTPEGGQESSAASSQEAPTEFKVRVSEQYTHTMQTDPGQFDWGDFANSLSVAITPDARWQEEGGTRLVRFEALAVRGGEVVGRASSGSFEVSGKQAAANDAWRMLPEPIAGEFANGLRALGEKIRIDFADPAQFHAPFPGSMVSPPEPAQLAGAAGGSDAIVIFADFADESLSETAATRPLVFMQAESTPQR